MKCILTSANNAQSHIERIRKGLSEQPDLIYVRTG